MGKQEAMVLAVMVSLIAFSFFVVTSVQLINPFNSNSTVALFWSLSLLLMVAPVLAVVIAFRDKG